MSDFGEMGLRALKKQMTHEAIAEAALKLTLDKGLDHATIDEIARRAFVSPRTFSNYFSCKEEAVVAADDHYTDDVVTALQKRPADEPPLQRPRRGVGERRVLPACVQPPGRRVGHGAASATRALGGSTLKRNCGPLWARGFFS